MGLLYTAVKLKRQAETHKKNSTMLAVKDQIDSVSVFCLLLADGSNQTHFQVDLGCEAVNLGKAKVTNSHIWEKSE